MNPDRKISGLRGVSKARDKATIKRLQMYRNFKAKRDESGKIIRPAPFQSKVPAGTVARVEPNRRWFGNVRVVCYFLLFHNSVYLVTIITIFFSGWSISTPEIPRRTWAGHQRSLSSCNASNKAAHHSVEGILQIRKGAFTGNGKL
jgi:hypothetical protein